MREDAAPNARIRRSLEGSADPRVIRTRAAILAAVHELSARTSDVTVAAVVREAGISRASFYAHYSGLEDFAIALTRDALVAISDLWSHDQSSPAEATRRAQQRLVDYFVDNRDLFTAVAALPVSRDLYLAKVRSMADVIEVSLATNPRRPAELEPAATARYIAGAAYGLIDAWLTGELALDEGALVEHLTVMLPPWLSATR